MIDLSSLPSEVVVAQGERAQIALPSYYGSGNTWSAAPVSGEEVARVWLETVVVPPPSPSARAGTEEPPSLVAAPERAIVLGLSPGVGLWRLVLARSFGPRSVTATHELHIRVVPAR